MFLDQEVPRAVVGMLTACGLLFVLFVLGFAIAWVFARLKCPPAWVVLLVLAIGFLGLTGFGVIQWQCHCNPSTPPSYATQAAVDAYHRDIAERHSAIIVPWAFTTPLTLMSLVASIACFVLMDQDHAKKQAAIAVAK